MTTSESHSEGEHTGKMASEAEALEQTVIFRGEQGHHTHDHIVAGSVPIMIDLITPLGPNRPIQFHLKSEQSLGQVLYVYLISLRVNYFSPGWQAITIYPPDPNATEVTLPFPNYQGWPGWPFYGQLVAMVKSPDGTRAGTSILYDVPTPP